MHELGESIKCMKKCPPPQSMMENLKVAIEELNSLVYNEHKIWHLINPDEKLTSTMKIIDLTRNPSGHYEKSVHISITIPHLNEGEKSDGDMKMQCESTCNVTKGGEPFATFPSLVIEIVGKLEHLVDSIHELGKVIVFEL